MSDQDQIKAVEAAAKEHRFVEAIALARKVSNIAVAMRLEEHVLQLEAEAGISIQETVLQHALRHRIASSSARARLEKMVAAGKATRAEEVRNGTRVVVYTYPPKP